MKLSVLAAAYLVVVSTLGLESNQGFKEGVKKLYHTSEQVDRELVAITKRCNQGTRHMKVNYHKGKTGQATLTSVSLKQNDGKPKFKVLLFFGEHSRELVSVESGLSLIQNLCGEAKTDKVHKDLVKYSLENAEFLIFTNIGVNSRKLVEKGRYCLRVNQNGIDLNRNWKDHWAAKGDSSEVAPGKKPFSQDETKILRDATKAFRPDLFLTVHSGTLGMYIPYAYSTESVPGPNAPAMLDVLNKMNPKYCNCDVGAAGKEVGYLCPGTCLDYIYDMGTKYSFAFEIYEHGRYKRKGSDSLLEDGPGSCLLQKEPARAGHSHNHDAFPEHPDDAHLHQQSLRRVLEIHRLQNKVHSYFPHPKDLHTSQCLEYFNPVTTKQYKGAMNNWVSAYLELIQRVHTHDKSGK